LIFDISLILLPNGKRKQGEVSCALDGSCQSPLMSGAVAVAVARLDFIPAI
jgi:hypothetical protein